MFCPKKIRQFSRVLCSRSRYYSPSGIISLWV
jgi:hypothetical protein